MKARRIYSNCPKLQLRTGRKGLQALALPSQTDLGCGAVRNGAVANHKIKARIFIPTFLQPLRYSFTVFF